MSVIGTTIGVLIETPAELALYHQGQPFGIVRGTGTIEIRVQRGHPLGKRAEEAGEIAARTFSLPIVGVPSA